MRSITLTPEGALFLTRCQRIARETEAAEDELALAHAAPRGKLRVSMPMVTKLLMPVIGEIMEAFPEIALDLDFKVRAFVDFMSVHLFPAADLPPPPRRD